MTTEQKDITIAGCVRQIDECNERIATLTAQRDRARAQVADMQAAAVKASQAGW